MSEGITQQANISKHQAKHWIFTWNNYDEVSVEESWEKWQPMMTYMIFAYEVGLVSGTPHIQGYIVLKKKERFESVRALCPTAYWAPAKGTPRQASDYCKKPPSMGGGHWKEFGELPASAAEAGGQTQKEKWVKIHEFAKANNLDQFLEDCPMESFLYMRKFEDLTKTYKPKPRDLPVLENYWYLGKSGTGKSRCARADFPDLYLKPTATKWWPNYKGQKNVLIDDLGKTHDYVLEWLKGWGDHYPFEAENKGNHTGEIRPERIIVTTQYHWDDITDDQELRDAIARRFKIVRFGNGLGERHWKRSLNIVGAFPSVQATPHGSGVETPPSLRRSETISLSQASTVIVDQYAQVPDEQSIDFIGMDRAHEARMAREEEEWWEEQMERQRAKYKDDDVCSCEMWDEVRERMEEEIIDLTED